MTAEVDVQVVEEAAGRLQVLATRYHKAIEAPDAFLSAILRRGDEELGRYLQWSERFVTKKVEGVTQISPVVFLRRVLVTRLLDDPTVALAALDEWQQAIDNRDATPFSDFPEYVDAIQAQKQRTKSAFVNWNPFRILFYIDYFFESAQVKEDLRTIARFLIKELKLQDVDHYLAGFDYNQNFGTDMCWLAISPSSIADHKDAHQVFWSADGEGFRFGLMQGSRVIGGKEKTERQAPGALDIRGTLDTMRRVLPDFYDANRRITQPKVTGAGRIPLNLVLYGPPGTGKTWSVQRLAVEAIEGATPDTDHAEITARFRRYLNDRKIEFLTFHPSYAYEEFVEGFRYDPEKGFPTLKDGVFKELVKRAQNPFQRTGAREGARIWKVSLGGSGDGDIYDRCIRNGEIAVGWFNGRDLSGFDRTEIANLFEEAGLGTETNNIRTINYFLNGIQEGDFVAVLKDQRTIRAVGLVQGPYEHMGLAYEKYQHVRPVRWIDQAEHDIYALNGSTYLTLSTVYPLDRVPLDKFIELVSSPSDDAGRYVLIIDEINRGNLSRIFGELITLLEPDKRKGGANELTVRLPYSQDPFTIPPNIHVIGTMNTADRSIALLDVALRRRFNFREVMPDAQVIKGILSAALDPEDDSTGFELTADQIDLVCQVFSLLNRRISLLLDRDHQIGHSYFLEIRSMSDLHQVWYAKVLPLLQEYFYNDADRLIRVLGAFEDEDGRRGFVRLLAGTDQTEFEVNSDAPWELHRYAVGELEEVLQNTFLTEELS